MTRVVLPGDLVYSLSSKKVVGAGLRKDGEDVYTVVPGVFHETDDKALISTLTKRYIPRAGDRVLGVVVAKIGDYFRIDIGSADLALLNFVSFEGATKRNRPMVKVGDLVYGQVILTSKHLEPELSCVDSEGRSRGMGVIATPGLVFSTSLKYARRLLAADNTFMTMLGRRFKFEISIGMNGKIWICAEKDLDTLAIRKIIIDAETTFESNYDLLIEQAVHDSQQSSADYLGETVVEEKTDDDDVEMEAKTIDLD